MKPNGSRQEKPQQLKIIAQVFNEEGCDFRIEKQKSHEISIERPAFLISNKAIYHQFSRHDCLLIGYAAAENNTLNAKKQLAILLRS